MQSLHTFTSSPSSCSYLPDQVSRIRYEVVGRLSPEEYLRLLEGGWRRFGHSLFKPVCARCDRCQSLRVPAAAFRPDRSQRRAAKLNEGRVALQIGPPSVSDEKLRLHESFHRSQQERIGWPDHGGEDAEAYTQSFVYNPFATQEWCYRIDGRLVGVGYVDSLPGGLSAIYFFHDPDERDRSLGVWNVLSVLRYAAVVGVPFVYLGYYVEGCRSLEYKARYRPNEILHPDGTWRPFG